MNLYLMRHGIAIAADDPSAVPDNERPLATKASHACAELRGGLCRLEIPFDGILTSPVLRARRDIAQYDLFAFIERAKALIESADHDTDPVEKLDDAAAQSMKAWEEVLTVAYEQRDQTHLHEFRIATKRLRYRAELLADLGQNNSKPLVQHLKELQTALGDWHDRCVLVRHVAEFIGRPNFLANHPDMGRALLAEMEKEKWRNETAIDNLFGGAAKVRESWGRRKPVRDAAMEKSDR